jgi:hypothetical protein
MSLFRIIKEADKNYKLLRRIPSEGGMGHYTNYL